MLIEIRKPIKIVKEMSQQERTNAGLLLQNATIQKELQKQKELNMKFLLELAEIKKGGN
ncbi:hypothetical protein [Inediibacterium massiliense]|uniref:hypothetical protein n=1 Tax=Inediibacterium massiliense TaxID=1658111 RepID=UPI0018FECA6C|nr:hypothetical protein [Inediibacterium massiliense]